jgi:hypothetical protein
MESKKINQLATELTPVLSDLTIIGDPTTGISRKITLSQMASLFTGTVEEYPNLASFPLVGTADTIYIALDTNIIYRWNTGTNAYVELSPNIVTSLVFNDANGFDGTINLVGSTATLTITTALTQGSVPFIGTSGALTQDNANLFFDDTNNRLGINTNAPTTALDVFGSGIIGRLNGTSTNNAFLGFASAGTNRWSIGNVQSDHRFRIYSETNTSELVSVLQTGEFGIGIANPTTKLHIDGGASALIANLDADVSIAKSISFRSDNSNRINLEVSGTESGSNVGADLFIRTYSDAGSLLNTPITIKRSTGNIGIFTNAPNAILDIAVDAATFNFPRIYDSRTQAIDRGGKLTLSGYSDSLTTITPFAQIVGLKSNGTSGDLTGYLALFVNQGSGLVEGIRLNASGQLLIGSTNSEGGKLEVTTTPSSKSYALMIGNNTNAAEGNRVSLAFKSKISLGSGIYKNATIDCQTEAVTSSMYGALIFSTMDATTLKDYMKLSSDGYLRMLTDGKGIQFNGDTAAANSLNDYEQGSWTPVLTPTTSGSFTLSVATGRYVKIGRIIHLMARIQTSSSSSPTGNLVISGIPYQCSSDTEYTPGVLGYTVNVVPQPFNITILSGVSYMEVWNQGNNQRYAAADFDDGGRISIQISYYTSA